MGAFSRNLLLTLQTAVVYPLYLNAHAFVQTAEHLVCAQAAGTLGRVGVLIGVKAHGARLLGQVVDEGDSSRFHSMPARRARA